MTLAEVFRFEVGYRVRQPSTWIYALTLLAVPFLLLHAINGSRLYLNAPVAVMQGCVVLGSMGMLITAGIFGDAASRDVQTRMHSLFYTSPVRESQYLAGRFLGGALVNAVLVMAIPLGLLIGSLMPYMSAGKFGPVRIEAYVQAYALVLLPNVLIIGAFMFAMAVLTRQALATYLGGLALFMLGTIAADLTNGAGGPVVQSLLSPFGNSAITEVTRLWTPIEQNQQLIGWPVLVFMNRALWIGIAAAAYVVLVARFRFAHSGGVARRRWWRSTVVDTAPDKLVPVETIKQSGMRRSFDFGARVRQTVAVAARSWREIAATKVFLLILAGAMLFVLTVGWDVGTERFGTSIWPLTHLVAGTVLGSFLPPVIALLIAIFAGELVWREREVGMGDIAAVAPISNGVAVAGRFVALLGMLVLLQTAFTLAGIMLQAIQGYTRFEIGVYLELLFGIKLVDYFLLAALAMAVHVVVNNKYLGHLIVVLYFASTLAAGLLGITNRMLIYGSDPGWLWSDFNGLAPFVRGLVWFKLYWSAWAFLFAILAGLFWVRGRELGVRRRLSLARLRLHGGTLRAAGLAVALIATLGGFVFYNTHIINQYRTPEEIAAQKATYERKYKRYENAPSPSLYAARLNVELYPAQYAAQINGTLRYVNRTDRAIDTLHVLSSQKVTTSAMRFDRAAKLVVNDPALHYFMYALERSIAPGDSIAMMIQLDQHSRGFRNAGAPTDVTPNAVYIEGDWLPTLGYSAGRELADEQKRHEFGLPPRVLPPSGGDVETRVGTKPIQLVDVETIIATDTNQTAVTPGRLIREWTSNGRRYFQFKTDEPLRYGGAILSGAYAIRRDTAQGVNLAVYYHPTHAVNVDRMIRSMRASLAYYTANFGPYQFKELRIVEFPRYAEFARAHPYTITFSEGGAFLTRVDSGDVDRTFFVVAHETAHQWWGGQVIPASAPGSAFVSETMAQYSSMMVLETAYGETMARKFYDYNMDEYLTNRSVYTNREAPLLDVSGQAYVYYMKGAVAMYTLRERLGADAVNGALRRFREKYADTNAPPATSRALYTELESVTPDSLKTLLSDLFEHITIWDLKTDSVKAEPVGGGAYRVRLFVDASKARADSIGNKTAIAMDDLVEVGVFGEATSKGDLLYLKQHRIRSGKQIVEITVSGKPVRAGVDPYRKMFERERGDNVVSVPAPASSREGLR